jgi:hypothetical protein
MKIKVIRALDIISIITYLLFMYIAIDVNQQLEIRIFAFIWFTILLISFVNNLKDRRSYNKFLTIKERSEVENENDMEELERLEYLSKQGHALERRVLSTLSEMYQDAVIFYDVIIKATAHKNTQIDLIAIIDRRIYVFECKAYNVRLTGSWEDKKILAHYKTPIEIENPVIQNQYHIKSLSKILFHGEDQYANIVVFGDYASYEYLQMPNYTRVSKAKDLKKNIESLKKYLTPVNSDTIREIKEELKPLCKTFKE